MPGLLRGVARTAVIAGTATTVSNRVSRRQANRWAAQDDQQYQQPPPSSSSTHPRRPPPQPVAAPAPDPIAQLKELAELKAQGILTDEEFAAQKAKILAFVTRQGGCHALPVPASADVHALPAAPRRMEQDDYNHQLQQAYSATRQVPAYAPAAAAPAPADDPLARLRELAQLHESGALTDDEFTAAKAKLLGRDEDGT